MRVALLNPRWTFAGSIYFGCREPHLPLEYGYAKAMLEARGHEAVIIDAQLDALSLDEVRARVEHFAPDIAVITTAPSYLFWRCAPPELTVPRALADAVRPLLRARGGRLVVVGPHASTTPRAALLKLDAGAAVLGECEEKLVELAELPFDEWHGVESVATPLDGDVLVRGGPHAADLRALPVLEWPAESVRRHRHHHHRFDAPPAGPGAEVEATRGCPYTCTFCAKETFRTNFRKRPVEDVLAEVDGLIDRGVEYIYFIDEIFMPQRPLLEALVDRPVSLGVQMRIDLWTPELLDLLGAAGCVSIEAGVESISEEGRERLDKRCKRSTEELSELLIHARKSVPFVQANLLDATVDDIVEVEAWRATLLAHGVWANKPVPLFPYPGSPDYRRLWGLPDDLAWERAHEHYLGSFDEFSDVQEDRPLPLAELEKGLRP